jgi:hypothetical protein
VDRATSDVDEWERDEKSLQEERVPAKSGETGVWSESAFKDKLIALTSDFDIEYEDINGVVHVKVHELSTSKMIRIYTISVVERIWSRVPRIVIRACADTFHLRVCVNDDVPLQTCGDVIDLWNSETCAFLRNSDMVSMSDIWECCMECLPDMFKDVEYDSEKHIIHFMETVEEHEEALCVLGDEHVACQDDRFNVSRSVGANLLLVCLDRWESIHDAETLALGSVMEPGQIIFGYVATREVSSVFGTVRDVRTEVLGACHDFCVLTNATTVDCGDGFFCLVLTFADPGNLLVCCDMTVQTAYVFSDCCQINLITAFNRHHSARMDTGMKTPCFGVFHRRKLPS